MPYGVFLYEDTDECRFVIGDCLATAETDAEATRRMLALYDAGDYDLNRMTVLKLAVRARYDKVKIALDGTEGADWLAKYWRGGVRPIRREAWPPSDHPMHGKYAKSD